MSTASEKGFNNFKLNKQLLSAIAEAGFTTPTPIQQKAIPLALAGHDLLGIAQTGTGKTAAYILPVFMKVKYAQGSTPRALILVPTRELAVQVGKHAEQLAVNTDLRILVAYGGVGPRAQVQKLEEGIDVLIGTPGRVWDLYKKQALDFKEVKTFVLDEADRMMDMGFMPQIRQLLEVIPLKKRQSLLFSATMPKPVVKLSAEFLEFPERVEITPQATTAATVDQFLYHVPNFKTKQALLAHLLKTRPDFNRVIVFVKKRQTASAVYDYLQQAEIGELRVIHANKGQNTRLNALDDFRYGEIRVLVATDVTARGIDIAEVTHVVNFDVPLLYEDYVHRVGRTGRAELSGEAYTFVAPPEQPHITKIETLIKKKLVVLHMPQEVPIFASTREELQEQARQVDKQKRKEDPHFKGAFHKKKYELKTDSGGYKKPSRSTSNRKKKKR